MMQMPELRRPHAIACIGCEETKTVQSILIKAVKAAIGCSPGLGGRIADLSAAAAAVVSESLASVCAAPCKSAFQAAVLAPLSVKVAACRDGVVHCGRVAAWQRGGVARDSHGARMNNGCDALTRWGAVAPTILSVSKALSRQAADRMRTNASVGQNFRTLFSPSGSESSSRFKRPTTSS